MYLYDSRLEIRQKFYTNGFLGQKFYTEKNLSIVTIFANDKTAFNINDFGPFFVGIEIKM